jgi:hypothetical protein
MAMACHYPQAVTVRTGLTVPVAETVLVTGP